MATKPQYKRIAQLKTAAGFREHLQENEIHLKFDDELLTGNENPFGKPYTLRSGRTIGNRFCVLPMEGWDGTTDGKPTDFTKRRWKNFAASGAKLLWGCEAFSVRKEGRANPNQLMITEDTRSETAHLYQLIINEHTKAFGTTDDLMVGLQLTHSGRFCKPNDHHRAEPKIAYHHPLLDRKFGIPDDFPVLSDADLDQLVKDYVKAAVIAQQAGFHFVDVKHCHGYLGHELLSGYYREGKYGGSFENRTRFLKNIVEGIRLEAPGLEIGVRLSAFDWVPFTKGESGAGIPEEYPGESYPFAFGGGTTGQDIDLSEPFRFLSLLESLDIELVCMTAGSPYYNPHIQRPALFPPSDGYLPPEDPLAGVARQIWVAGEIKEQFPDLALVGSAYSYLQEWLPHVGQHVLRSRQSDFIGLGRMILSYPDLPDDVLKGRSLQRNKICRTFSDCTTAPRNGMRSGCYPLDPFYKGLTEAEILKELKS